MIRRPLIAIVCLLVLGPGLSADGLEVRDRKTPTPYFDAMQLSSGYAGPGREDPEPTGLDEVRIGYFGPSDPDHPSGGDLWLASVMAVEEANRVGGYRGLPFRLVPAWSEEPWGTGVADLARAVYSGGVWAIIGSIDGSATHLAEQVVAKARLTLISPASTDTSVHLANVPWMFSCLPADDALAAALAPAIADRLDGDPFIVISATDHDSHHAVSELIAHLGRQGLSPSFHLEFDPGTPDLLSILEQVTISGAGSVAVFADPRESARVVTALRSLDRDLAIFGGHPMGRRAFGESAGEDGAGVVFPLPCDASYLDSAFSAEFRARSGRLPDCATVQTYDATRMAIEAIREAGLNRARIRDAVQALSPWTGAAGPVEWNSLRQNEREVRTATIDGVIRPR